MHEHVKRRINRRLGVDDGMGAGVDGHDQNNKSEQPEHQQPALRPDLWPRGSFSPPSI